jgi:hypothetical protein
MKKPAAKKEKFDPFFQDVPWEIHQEGHKIIAEVFLLPSHVRDEGTYKGVSRNERKALCRTRFIN